MGRSRRLLFNKKGIVGIEAAIVLIAFVIIAAALSYVVVNMGFFASQKAKDTISRGMEEATSALQLDGSLIAKTNDTCAAVSYIVIPVKLSVGRESVDVSENTTVVTVQISGNNSYYMSNIYNGTVSAGDYDPANLTQTLENLFGDGTDPVAYFAIENSDGDKLLESKEKAFLLIYFGNSTFAWEYDTVKIEVKGSRGASLTVEREIPAGLAIDEFIDLG
ncbi:MAG: archaellin/type IV pilin N-terminal domain-containing protein [Candidatus Freyarchaeota archaeon]